MELIKKKSDAKDMGKESVVNDKSDEVIKENFATIENGDNSFNFDNNDILKMSGNIPQLDGLHGQRKLTSNWQESMNLKIVLPFKCEICNFSSSHEDRLRRHENKKKRKPRK